MKNTYSRKLLALLCAALLLMASSALALTVEPEQTQLPEQLGVSTYPATLGTYSEEDGSFPVTFYERDTYTQEALDALQVGDVLVFCDAAHTIAGIGESPDGIPEMTFEDGEDILLDPQQDGSIAVLKVEDDMPCMHVLAERSLKAAADITLTDYSDLEQDDPVILTSLPDILALQAQKQAESIGFDHTVTTVSLNENGEISEIRIFYAPWQ